MKAASHFLGQYNLSLARQLRSHGLPSYRPLRKSRSCASCRMSKMSHDRSCRAVSMDAIWRGFSVSGGPIRRSTKPAATSFCRPRCQRITASRQTLLSGSDADSVYMPPVPGSQGADNGIVDGMIGGLEARRRPTARGAAGDALSPDDTFRKTPRLPIHPVDRSSRPRRSCSWWLAQSGSTAAGEPPFRPDRF